MRIAFAVATVAALFTSGAIASTFVIGNGQGSSSGHDGIVTAIGGAVTESFGTGVVANESDPTNTANCKVTRTSVITLGGDYLLGAGGTINRRREPSGDRGCYLSAGNASLISTTTINFKVPNGKFIDYIGFYIGSVDPYNYFQFQKADGTPIANNLADGNNGYEANGDEFNSLNGGDYTDPTNDSNFASLFLEATFDSNEALGILQLRNTNYATEIDNLAYHFANLPPIQAHAVQARSAQPLAVDAPGMAGLMGFTVAALAAWRGRQR